MDKNSPKTIHNGVVLNNEQSKYEVIRLACKELEWQIGDINDVWQVYWSDSSMNLSHLVKNAKRFQRINHFVGMVSIYRKSHLAKSLNNMRKLCNEEYNFYPNTFTMPSDREEIIRLSKIFENDPRKCWIVKPASGSQGRGIFLTFNLNDIDLDNSYIIQEYITNPLLIDGYKFDLRIYVLIVCCEPLRLFIYREGLVRLCTEKYDVPSEENLGLAYMHLTNYAINKNNENFVQNNDTNSNNPISTSIPIDVNSATSYISNQTNSKDFSESSKNNNSDSNSNSSKRSLSWFMQYVTSLGQDSQKLWEGIGDVITKTMISAQPTLSHSLSTLQANSSKISNSHQMNKNISEISPFTCFELLGFDILITDTFQPVLLEVNHSPSFSMDSPLDYNIKTNLIKNTMLLLDAQPTDAANYFQNIALTSQMRLHGSSFSGMSYKEYQKRISGDSYSNIWTRFLRNERVNIGDYQLLYPTNEYRNQWRYVPPSFSSASMSPSTTTSPSTTPRLVAFMNRSHHSLLQSDAGQTTTSMPQIMCALNSFSPKQQLYLNLLEGTRLRYWSKLSTRNTPSLSHLLIGVATADNPQDSPGTTLRTPNQETVEESRKDSSNDNNISSSSSNSGGTSSSISPLTIASIPTNINFSNKSPKSMLTKRPLRSSGSSSSKLNSLEESWMRNKEILTPMSMISLNMHSDDNNSNDNSHVPVTRPTSSSISPKTRRHLTTGNNSNSNITSPSPLSLSLSPQRPVQSKPSTPSPAYPHCNSPRLMRVDTS